MIHWIMLGIFCVSVAVLSLLHYCQRQVISGLELDLDNAATKHRDNLCHTVAITPSEAVYGFASWLSTRPGSIIVGAEYECTELAGLCKQWCDANDLPRPRDEYCPDNLEKRLNDNL